MNKIPNRLRQLRLKFNNLTQKQLAEQLGIGSTVISETEQGIRPLGDKLALALIKVFKYDIENDVYFDDVSNIDLNSKNKVKIPFIRASVAAGSGLYISDDVEIEPLIFDKRFLPSNLNFENIQCFPVSGDSMTTPDNKGIFDGDILFVDITEKNIYDGIYVIQVNNDLRVKRLTKKLNGNLLIQSDNPKYPTEEFNIEEENITLSIVGRVVFNITKGNNLNKFNKF